MAIVDLAGELGDVLRDQDGRTRSRPAHRRPTTSRGTATPCRRAGVQAFLLACAARAILVGSGSSESDCANSARAASRISSRSWVVDLTASSPDDESVSNGCWWGTVERHHEVRTAGTAAAHPGGHRRDHGSARPDKDVAGRRRRGSVMPSTLPSTSPNSMSTDPEHLPGMADSVGGQPFTQFGTETLLIPVPCASRTRDAGSARRRPHSGSCGRPATCWRQWVRWLVTRIPPRTHAARRNRPGVPGRRAGDPEVQGGIPAALGRSQRVRPSPLRTTIASCRSGSSAATTCTGRSCNATASGAGSARPSASGSGPQEMAMPLVRGIGPTLIPRPQRMPAVRRRSTPASRPVSERWPGSSRSKRHPGRPRTDPRRPAGTAHRGIRSATSIRWRGGRRCSRPDGVRAPHPVREGASLCFPAAEMHKGAPSRKGRQAADVTR